MKEIDIVFRWPFFSEVHLGDQVEEFEFSGIHAVWAWFEPLHTGAFWSVGAHIGGKAGKANFRIV